MSRSTILSLVALAAVVIIGVAYRSGYFHWARNGAVDTVNDGGGKAAGAAVTKGLPTEVAALGKIEPADGIIDVSGPPGDRIWELNVAPGKDVAAGDELARLESYRLRESELSLAKAQLAEAESALAAELAHADRKIAEARLGVELAGLAEQELDTLRARSELAGANRALAEKNLERWTALDRTIVSEQQLDQQRLVVEQARADERSAQAQIKQLEQTSDLKLQQSQAFLAASEAARLVLPAKYATKALAESVKLAAARQQTALVVAPSDGLILKVMAQAGEATGTGPILQLAKTSSMVVIAEVYEDNVRYVRAGQPASITASALAEPLSGTVTHVGIVVAGNNVTSLNPRDPVDVRVVEVRIALDDKSVPLAARYIGLQVDVLIRTGGASNGGAETVPSDAAADSQPRGAAANPPTANQGDRSPAEASATANNGEASTARRQDSP